MFCLTLGAPQITRSTCGPHVWPPSVSWECLQHVSQLFLPPSTSSSCCWQLVSVSAESQHPASSWGGGKRCSLAAHCYCFTPWYVEPEYYYTQAHCGWMSLSRHAFRKTLTLISKIKLCQISLCAFQLIWDAFHGGGRWLSHEWFDPFLWTLCLFFEEIILPISFFMWHRDSLFFWFSMTHIHNSWSVPAPLYLPKKERLKIGCMPQLLRYSGSGQSLPPSSL